MASGNVPEEVQKSLLVLLLICRVCTWYPGKLNSLVFNGKIGTLVKETLIAACESTPFSARENNIHAGNGRHA